MLVSVRSRLQAGLASAVVFGGLCGLVGAQDVAVETQVTTQPKQVRKVSALMKSKVLIQQDQAAGQVVDVVLSEGGCIDYLVVDYNQQSYVVPYAAVQLRVPDQVVFVDITPAQFQQVQYFPANSWPDLYAVNYRRNVFRTFNVDVDVNNGRGRREALKPIQDPAERRQRQDQRQELRQEQREDRQNLRQDQREDRNNPNNAAPKDRPEVNPAPKPDRTKPLERNESSAKIPAADGQPGPRPGVIDPPGPKAPEATEAPKSEPRP